MIVNKDSYNQLIHVNFNRDLTQAIGMTMILEPEISKTQLSQTVTAVLGNTDIIIDDETYKQNEYISYEIQEDTFEDSGRWRKKGIATLPSETISTNYSYFRVLP